MFNGKFKSEIWRILTFINFQPFRCEGCEISALIIRNLVYLVFLSENKWPTLKASFTGMQYWSYMLYGASCIAKGLFWYNVEYVYITCNLELYVWIRFASFLFLIWNFVWHMNCSVCHLNFSHGLVYALSCTVTVIQGRRYLTFTYNNCFEECF